MRKSRYIMLLLTALAVFGLAGCNDQTDANSNTQSLSATSSGSTAESAPREKRRVIIDTDTGADDAAALILAAKDEYTEIVGVTVLVGNVDLEKSADNALMALETAGADIPVK